MGHFVHGAAEHVFEDRLLAHLKLVMGQKLRRHESFFLNWDRSPEEGSGRVSVWVSPHIPVMFRFAGSRPPALNQAWLKVMSLLSSSPKGLTVISEHDAEEFLKSRSHPG